MRTAKNYPDIMVLWKLGGAQGTWYPTPWKINMENTNHQFWKENYIPNLYDYVPC